MKTSELEYWKRDSYEKGKRIAELEKENAELKERIAALEKLVEELLRKLNKNSGNSSKPPSSDGIKQIPNSRKKSGRKAGGQKGHIGSTLRLPENFEELIKSGAVDHEIDDRTNGAGDYVIRYTMDVRVRTVLTEHRFPCNAPIPEEFTSFISYGKEIKALTTILSVEGMIALNRLARFFSEITNGVVEPSEATLNSFVCEVAENADIEPLIEDLLEGAVMNVDDTLMRSTERPVEDKSGNLVLDSDGNVQMETAEHKSFQVGVRTYSNDKTTLITANGHKNNAGVIRDGILPCYNGILESDFEAKFLNYGGKNALCGAHLERDFKGLYDCEPIRPWSESFLLLMQTMCHHKNNDLRNGVEKCDDDQLREFAKRFRKLAAEGTGYLSKLDPKSAYYRKAKALVERMNERESEYMLFMRDYRVPYTNNLAERDLRPGKTKQKVSGNFRSFKGIKVYCKLRSIISTVKKRTGNVLAALKNCLSGKPCFAN